MNLRRIGSEYERRAAAYVEARGVTILCRNYRKRSGEIDLIGTDGEYLVFFEVKERSGRGAGYAAEAVTGAKRRTICVVSLCYLNENGYTPDTPVRYDVIAVDGDEVTWIRNAFDYIGRAF